MRGNEVTNSINLMGYNTKFYIKKQKVLSAEGEDSGSLILAKVTT